MTFKYISESEEYGEIYFKLQKVLFVGDRYKNMTLKTKVAYSVLRDRNQISIMNNWVDEKGHIYFKYSNVKLAEILGVSERQVTKIKAELKEFNLLKVESDHIRLGKKIGFENNTYRLYLGKLRVGPEDVYLIKKYQKENLEALEKNAISGKGYRGGDSLELEKNASSDESQVYMESSELAISAIYKEETNNKDSKDFKDINKYFYSGIEIFDEKLEDMLVEDYIEKNQIYSYLGNNFINVLKLFGKNNFNIFEDIYKKVFYAIKSAEKESGTGLMIYDFSSVTFEFKYYAREELTKTLYECFRRAKTDHRVINIASYTFTSLKNKALDLISIQKEITNDKK